MTPDQDQDTRQNQPCAACEQPAVVAFGTPPRWLCMEHFNQALKGVGDMLNQIRDRFSMSRDDPRDLDGNSQW